MTQSRDRFDRCLAMMQLSFAMLAYRHKKKQTKREKFLGEMDVVVSWALLLALIEPYYPKAGNGRRPHPLEVMLRIYFPKQWYQLSDPGAEEALCGIQSMRAFTGLELGHDAIRTRRRSATSAACSSATI